MSAQTKTKAQKAGKFLGIALFAFLMFFNIKFALGDSANGDVDLFGLKVSVFTTSAYASGQCDKWIVEVNDFVYCPFPGGNCCGVVIVTP